MDRTTTSFTLSAESQLDGGLSQHDFSLHTSPPLGVLRCACPTCVFVGPAHAFLTQREVSYLKSPHFFRLFGLMR